MKKLIWGSIISGLIVFGWNAISWMVLPWHAPLFNQLQNDSAVQGLLKENAAKGGIYLSPYSFETKSTVLTEVEGTQNSSTPKQNPNTPFAFIVFSPNGLGSMNFLMARAILLNIIGAFFVTLLLLQSEVSTYLGRVGFTVIFGLSAGVISYLPQWNWWGFPIQYSVMSIIDLIIGWFFASLVLAKISERPKMNFQTPQT